MANSHFILLLLLFALCCVPAQQRLSNMIGQGSFLTLSENSSWLSPSGLFAFGFYQNGIGIFLAGFPFNKTVVWTANRNDPVHVSGSTLRLTTDGRLVLEQKSPNSITITITDVVKLDQLISSASMLDSGNFVLYNSSQEMIWQSFDHPTDTILPGQILSNGQELFSSVSESDYSKGIFRLKMQSDANLVLYPVDTMDSSFNSYWSTATFGRGGMNVTLNLDPDGHLYLLNNSISVMHNISEASPEKQRLYLMKIHTNGFLRLYSLSLDERSKSSSIVWESSWQSSQDECVPKGICGNNGYCTLDSTTAICKCPLGFHSVNRTVGCQRNTDYTVENCKNKENPIHFIMTRLENVTWDNEPYPVYKTNTAEDCKTDCFNQCECDAAFFKNGMCFQVKLPLRYGKTVSTDPIITYIKWASETSGKKKRNNKGHQSVIIALTSGIGAGLVLMLVFLMVSYWGVRQRKNIKLKENFFKQNGGIMLQQLLYKSESTAERAKIYTEEELKKATDNYKDSNIIGQGGYGTVYKGVLADTVVAIKKSKVVDRSQIDQFVNEVIILSQINHPNVVKLLGCCLETAVPLLVYEFVTNDTLFHHLHDEGCVSSIPWDMRLRIATETSGALAHMHSALVHIIHRDVKSANILLDDQYTAKVSDFGVSRLFSLEETHLATLVQGTFGYIDPEYFHSGILTQKSDVYSFGIVLLELLTGANVVSFVREEKDRNLSMYFLSAMEDDRLHEILEPRVRKEGHAEQLRGVAELAKRCLRIKGDKRPTMKEVEEELVELREFNIKNHSWVEIGPNVEEIEPLLEDIMELYDSSSTSGFDSMNVPDNQRR